MQPVPRVRRHEARVETMTMGYRLLLVAVVWAGLLLGLLIGSVR